MRDAAWFGGLMLLLFYVIGGWKLVVAAALVAVGCAFMSLAHGETLFLRLLAAFWTILLITVSCSSLTECPEGAPNHCAVGR